ncbi:CwfJ C-terminus 2-domain-containing protein-like protein [Baffinella frigidus]|nr:CwfJ C-terminus 2-domain-containing protein-like protein [Cryptophyta sp. CCMP2293]
MDLGKMPHAYLECAANAPMYFKKALSECENEWDAQNKQIIDTKGVKKLSSKIPRHMPYFSVEFGLQGGFAHVVENEQKFSKAFGRDILAGILNLPAQTLARQRSSIEEEKQLAQGFEASFKPFDWTASQ